MGMLEFFSESKLAIVGSAANRRARTRIVIASAFTGKPGRDRLLATLRGTRPASGNPRSGSVIGGAAALRLAPLSEERRAWTDWAILDRFTRLSKRSGVWSSRSRGTADGRPYALSCAGRLHISLCFQPTHVPAQGPHNVSVSSGYRVAQQTPGPPSDHGKRR
jgi:hypothetical protein